MHGRTTIPTSHKLGPKTPRIMIYNYHQDDPAKCTATKLEKFGLAQPIRGLKQIPQKAIVLNPFSQTTLTLWDRETLQLHGVVALDCSWNKADVALESEIRGEGRRLPTLLAGNPTNYASRGRLSTVEALAAALVITGFSEVATQLLGIFKWGETFLTLNHDPLEEYALTPPDRIVQCEREYFPIEKA